jgi:hypothetical protein
VKSPGLVCTKEYWKQIKSENLNTTLRIPDRNFFVVKDSPSPLLPISIA